MILVMRTDAVYSPLSKMLGSSGIEERIRREEYGGFEKGGYHLLVPYAEISTYSDALAGNGSKTFQPRDFINCDL